MKHSPHILVGLGAGLLGVAGVLVFNQWGQAAGGMVPHSPEVGLSRTSDNRRQPASVSDEDAGGSLPGSEASVVVEKSAGSVKSDARIGEFSPSLPGADVLPSVGWTEVAAAAPGNFLSYSDRQAVVVAFQQVPEVRDVALSVVITPASEKTNGEAPVSGVSESNSNLLAGFRRRGGFTHEEELFRTKWGWTALDQVQKTLRDDANGPP